MPEFWTFSGINSWSEAAGNYVDYTWSFLRNTIQIAPTRRYSSRLGTGSHYGKPNNVLGLGAENKLNLEAVEFVRSGGGYTPPQWGALRGKAIKVMLVAPKTTTQPPNSAGLFVKVYWCPLDQVPNQAIIRLDTLTFWRKHVRGGGQVWPVENRNGRGFGRGHDFDGFMVDRPKILKRVRTRDHMTRRWRYVWTPTGETAPSPLRTLRGWLQDRENDVVILAHSQGANIATHFLRHGFAT